MLNSSPSHACGFHGNLPSPCHFEVYLVTYIFALINAVISSHELNSPRQKYILNKALKVELDV